MTAIKSNPKAKTARNIQTPRRDFGRGKQQQILRRREVDVEALSSLFDRKTLAVGGKASSPYVDVS
jgi:hypothetical protein